MNRYIVTGASRGIGNAIARKLLAQGHFVVCGYNSSATEVRALATKYPNRCSIAQADFSTVTGVPEFISALAAGPFDGLVNNAGIFEMDGFAEWDPEIWYRTFQVNLTAPIALTMALRDRFRSGGSIVNVSSLDGLLGSFQSMAYSAAKAALINATKSLANNFGERNIRVNTIAPGWIKTAMSTPESLESRALTPLGRDGSPEDVARVVSFLLSSDSSFITGACLVVDGGYSNVDYIMMQEGRKAVSGARALAR